MCNDGSSKAEPESSPLLDIQNSGLREFRWVTVRLRDLNTSPVQRKTRYVLLTDQGVVADKNYANTCTKAWHSNKFYPRATHFLKCSHKTWDIFWWQFAQRYRYGDVIINFWISWGNEIMLGKYDLAIWALRYETQNLINLKHLPYRVNISLKSSSTRLWNLDVIGSIQLSLTSTTSMISLCHYGNAVSERNP